LETTGTDRYRDVPVSFAFIPYEGGRPSAPAITSIVNPGRPIPEGAVAVHGISNERAEAEGISLFDAAIEIVTQLLEASATATPIVGANLVYDLSMVEALARRELGVGLLEQGFNAPVVDVLVLDKTFAKWRKGPRKLEVLSELYGVTLTGAHDAAADATASVEVALAQAERYATREGRDKAAKYAQNVDLSSLPIAELHQRQVEWHRLWAEDFSEWLAKSGKRPLSADELLWPIATEDDIPSGGSSSGSID
jgi:DNA polymerase-3 subunit epsilon